MKRSIRIFAVWLTSAFLCLPAFARPEGGASVPCGEQAVCRLEGGTLAVTGSGTVPADFFVGTPWEPEEVLRIEIGEGITAVGDNAFSNLYCTVSLSLPETLTAVGNNAFEDCDALAEVNFPAGLKTLGYYAFANCSVLCGGEIDLKATALVSIGNRAFNGCHPSVLYLPRTLKEIGECVADDDRECQVYYAGSPSRWAAVTVNPNNPVLFSPERPVVCELPDGEPHPLTEHAAAEPTCTEPGNIPYWECETCLRLYLDPDARTETEPDAVLRPPLGHDWLAAVCTPDDSSGTVTAVRVCRRDASHRETETAPIRTESVSPDRESPGEVRRTAVFEKEGFGAWSESREIPALKDLRVLVLPEDLEAVEADAFAGTDCQAVILPAGCRSVGPGAFRDCPGLIYVRLPAGAEADSTAFGEPDPLRLIERTGK